MYGSRGSEFHTSDCAIRKLTATTNKPFRLRPLCICWDKRLENQGTFIWNHKLTGQSMEYQLPIIRPATGCVPRPSVGLILR